MEGKGLGIAICSDREKPGIRIRNVTRDGPFGKVREMYAFVL